MADILKEIHSMRDEFDIFNERLDQIEEQLQTDEYVYPVMFGASAIHERYGS